MNAILGYFHQGSVPILNAEEFQRRLKEVQEMNWISFPLSTLSVAPEIEVNSDVSIAAVVHTLWKPGSICINPLFLLKKDDIPSHLRIDDPNDPRLQDRNYFDALSAWLSATCEIDKPSPERLQTSFPFFLKLMQDPDLAQRAKKFILAHEVGHVLQDSLPVQLGFFFTVLCCVSCALIFFASQLSLPPLVCGITLVVSLNIAPQFFAKVITARCFRFQESRADDFAHRVMGDIDAAKHSFAAYEKMLDVMDRRFAKQSVLGKIASILFNPDGVFHLSHPSPQERLERVNISEAR